jgi:hypothetical protein
LFRVSLAVALFQRADFQRAEMLMQRIANQGRTIAFGPAGGSVGGNEELSVKNNLDRFHMWNLFHSIVHILCESIRGCGSMNFMWKIAVAAIFAVGLLHTQPRSLLLLPSARHIIGAVIDEDGNPVEGASVDHTHASVTAVCFLQTERTHDRPSGTPLRAAEVYYSVTDLLRTRNS